MRGTLFDHVSAFLLPPACAGCGGAQAWSETLPVCRNCRLGLRPVPHPLCPRCGQPMGTGRAPTCLDCKAWPAALTRARAACLLASPASELVHALKYQGWRGVGEVMGREVATRLKADLQGGEVVVPVPTSSRNERRRGYNQARVVAQALSRVLELPLADALIRPDSKTSQTSLGPMARSVNVLSAFELSAGHDVSLEGRKVILVDDVITTGATIQAASRALEDARPAAILACAFARRIPFGD